MKRNFVLALVLSCAPVSAFSAEWWQGYWAYDQSWCKHVAQIGEVTPAPIAITQSKVVGYENTCTIANARALPGMRAVHLAMDCRGEGSTYRETRLIMGGGDVIWMWFGQDAPLKFYRCQPPRGTMDWLNKK